MEAVAWAALGLIAATLAAVFYLSTRIDALGSSLNARIDALGASLGARIDVLSSRVDVLSSRLEEHLRRHAG